MLSVEENEACVVENEVILLLGRSWATCLLDAIEVAAPTQDIDVRATVIYVHYVIDDFHILSSLLTSWWGALLIVWVLHVVEISCVVWVIHFLIAWVSFLNIRFWIGSRSFREGIIRHAFVQVAIVCVVICLICFKIDCFIHSIFWVMHVEITFSSFCGQKVWLSIMRLMIRWIRMIFNKAESVTLNRHRTIKSMSLIQSLRIWLTNISLSIHKILRPCWMSLSLWFLLLNYHISS